MKFFRAYSVDSSISNTYIQYLCPVRKCKSPVGVSTKMGLYQIKEMFGQTDRVRNQSKFNEIFENLEYLYKTDIQDWVPYFDGVQF